MSSLAPLRTMIVRQADLVRRADPRHLRLTLSVAEALRVPNYPLVPLGKLLREKIKYGTSHALETDGIGFPVLRTTNLTPDGLDISDLKTWDASTDEAKPLRLQEGDLLVNRSNSLPQIGKAVVYTLTGDYLFAGYVLRIRLDTARVLPDFVALFLNSPAGHLQAERLARPITGIANINPTELSSILIPVPSLGEQRRLLAPLRTALDAKNRKRVEARSQLIGINDDFARLVGSAPVVNPPLTFAAQASSLRAADRMAPSFFNQERLETMRAVMALPGVTTKRLIQLVDFISRKVPVEPGAPTLGMSAAEAQTGELTEVYDDLDQAKSFETGDILIGALRPYLNKIVVMGRAGQCSQMFHVLRPKPGVDANYLAVALRSPLVLHQVIHMAGGGSRPVLAEADAGGIFVPVPSEAVRQEIAKLMADRQTHARQLRQEAEGDWGKALFEFDRALLLPATTAA